MNENIKKVLFGNQKQSLKQNEAIVNFVEEFLDGSDFSTLESTRESILSGLEHLATVAAEGTKLRRLEDKLFVEYILGVDGRAAMEGKDPCKLMWKPVGENGKIVFYVEPTGSENLSDYSVRLSEEAKQLTSEQGEKAANKEDLAWELIQKILSVTPQAKRAELPKEDALAAILVSKEYWAVNN